MQNETKQKEGKQQNYLENGNQTKDKIAKKIEVKWNKAKRWKKK